MVYFSSLEKRGILAYATVWMKLKDIILSEISKCQKDKYYTTHLYEVGIKLSETESRMVIVKGWLEEREIVHCCSMG